MEKIKQPMPTELTIREQVTEKSAWRRFFYAGVSSNILSEDVRRILVINLFTMVGVFFMLPLGIFSVIQGQRFLGFALLTIAFLYLANHVFLRYTHNHHFSGYFIIYPLYALMLFLVYTGGVDGTGLVWIYCVPAIALFLNGMKRGLMELGLFSCALILLMFLPMSDFHAYDYSLRLKARVLLSFFVVIFLSAIYEYSMSRYNEELKQTSEKLRLVAQTDALTGLLNRRGMQQRLEKSTYNTFHLLLADLDYFKKINDEYGHDAGDYVLTELSSIFKASLPEVSSASRWGGEEFLFAVCNMSGQEAYELAETLRQKVEDYEFQYGEFCFHITLSFGVATMDVNVPLGAAMKLADKRLYRAKRAGRNQTCRVEM